MSRISLVAALATALTATMSVGAAVVATGGELPPPTMQPPALGDPNLDALAQRCYDGDLAACDELLDLVGFDGPGGDFAASCAGRQSGGNELFHTSCVNGFPGVAAPTVPPVTTATPQPTVPAPPTTGLAANGEVVPYTERATGAVTVLGAGDAMSAVALNSAVATGTAATVTSSTFVNGQEDSFGLTSDFEHTFTQQSVDEIVAVSEDGSVTGRWTRTSGTRTSEYSNPEREDNWTDSSIIDGLPVLIDYGPDRQSRLMRTLPETGATPEQVALLSGNSQSLGPALPDSPVGVGATWTWSTGYWVYAEGFDAPANATSRLDAIDGDQYTITTTLAIDLAEVPAERLASDVAAVTGTATITVTDVGSITNPLSYQRHAEGQVDVTIDHGDGMWTLHYTVAVDTLSTPS